VFAQPRTTISIMGNNKDFVVSASAELGRSLSRTIAPTNVIIFYNYHLQAICFFFNNLINSQLGKRQDFLSILQTIM